MTIFTKLVTIQATLASMKSNFLVAKVGKNNQKLGEVLQIAGARHTKWWTKIEVVSRSNFFRGVLDTTTKIILDIQ